MINNNLLMKVFQRSFFESFDQTGNDKIQIKIIIIE